GGISDIGNAKIDVAAFVSREIGLSVREGCRGAGVVIARRCLHRVSVSVYLAVDRVRWACDLCLIEGNGNDLMTAEIADIADIDGQIIARLPLPVECVVDGVG